jgi:hypothetical protein
VRPTGRTIVDAQVETRFFRLNARQQQRSAAFGAGRTELIDEVEFGGLCHGAESASAFARLLASQFRIAKTNHCGNSISLAIGADQARGGSHGFDRSFPTRVAGQMDRAATQGRMDILINPGELCRSIPSGTVGAASDAMQSEIEAGDILLVERANGAGMTVRYLLPRTNSHGPQ